jgi:hypothetical protein
MYFNKFDELRGKLRHNSLRPRLPQSFENDDRQPHKVILVQLLPSCFVVTSSAMKISGGTHMSS